MDRPSPAQRFVSWLVQVAGTPARPSRIIDERYKLDTLLGRGGTGEVYRAHDARLDRIVAVKLVRPEVLPDAAAQTRFKAETGALTRLHHRSIVEIFDYGTFPDGGGYLVMELVEGEDLRRLLHREGRLGAERALPIVAAVCDAVEAAHRAGVLHRDLKPENILLSNDGADVKVFDFGMARTDPSPLAAGAAITGTPAYMAPQQFQGAPHDVSSDVFSLGVLAYEVLSGELPFGRGTVGEIALAQQRGVPPLPPALIPSAAERTIRSALDPNPDRRPSSASAFAHLLAAGLLGSLKYEV